MILEKISEIIAEHKDLNPKEITLEKSLEDLGLDSLDSVELVLALEEEFDITIQTDEPIKTVAELVEMIENLKK